MSNKTEHTPGPYAVKENNYLIEVVLQKKPYLAFGSFTKSDMGRANANLFAAAPELLEALQALKDAFIHTEGNAKGNKAKTEVILFNPDMKAALKSADAAIAKAEGN